MTQRDVARELDVSHGSIYRHFSSKAALRDAVTRRWLERVEQPLAGISRRDGPAGERLREWITTLIAVKRDKRRQDPEMFATYYQLAEDATVIVQDHVDELLAQLTAIVHDGVEQGVFAVSDPASGARAVFDATTRFHHPALANEWDDAAIDDHFEAVWALVQTGLRAD
ncbi:MAG: TetR family transcriptional regulator [Bacteroidetes bacterium SW_9_63_38]|nr:MAG: TetR family transcriptional regulator [Bacteroidetes bacterium SW_9_63_38]